jgi:hypothetical protein
MTDPELIAAAIVASDLSARRFAERILSRDERTIRRWSAGDIAIPAQARNWLLNWISLGSAARARVVKTLA